MKNWFKLFVTGIILVTVTACGNQEGTPQESEGNDTENVQTALNVVATNSIIADMAEQVGGDLINMHSIVPVGTDPHEHEVLPEDIQKAEEADIILYNALNLETGNGWFNNLMETTNKTENEDFFAVSKDVEPLYLTSAGQTDQADPHAWLDLQNGIKYVREIEQIFISKDPTNETTYTANADAYIEQLNELDTQAKSAFNDIPEEKKLLVTSEGAFKYFAKAYGLVGGYIWEINTESQGTPEQMTQIIDSVETSEVPVLFVETSVDSRSMERVSQETGLPIYTEIYTDSIAKEGEPGDSYYNMMKWNIEKVHEGLNQTRGEAQPLNE
ncbi:metal ABC transporter substrate-binding protein [Desemzia sp. RIT804]|uniref:metal ABC transporter substrate-binding protein n=1 Tax=Desemzia sp. RIT 804 TaxID=2810209 RepID=UPI0019509893|nr:metal ABC transporter substrate-binding protein [Desemzia sp. RIT 804]MBM6615403.1 metal ABC transporter substrate-binding protein [Desemzia sp. RIT 804]